MRRKSLSNTGLPLRAGVWYTASSIITKGISMLSTPVFTRLMSGEEYAVYPLYLGWIGIIGSLCATDAIGSAAQVAMQRLDQDRHTVLRSAALLEIGAIGIICALYFTFYDIFGPTVALGRRNSLILFIQLSLDAITGTMLIGWRYGYRYKPTFALSTASAAASAVISFLLIRRLGLGGEGRIIGMLWASCAVTLIAVACTLRRGKPIDRAAVAFLLKRSAPLVPQGIFTALLAGADRIMIRQSYGAQALAEYSVAHSLGASIYFVSTAMLFALRPWVLRKLAASDHKKIREMTDLAVPLLCVCALAVACIAPEAMRILAPIEYSAALSAVFLSALCAVPSFIIGINTTVALYNGRAGLSLLPTAASGVCSVGLNLLLFSSLPYTVASLTSLTASCIGAFLWSLCARRGAEGRIFSPVRCTLLILLTLVAGYAVYLARELAFLRAILLAIVIVVPAPMYRKIIKNGKV